MTNGTKTAVSPKKKGGAAVARSEAKKAAKTVTFRDLTLKLPPELPATMLFDITELEAAGNNPMPLFRLLRSIVGADQFVEIRNAVDGGDLEDIGTLFEDVIGEYGLSLGE